MTLTDKKLLTFLMENIDLFFQARWKHMSEFLQKIIDGFKRIDFKSFWEEFVALIKSVM